MSEIDPTQSVNPLPAQTPETTGTSESSRSASPNRDKPRTDADTVSIEALFPTRDIRLVIDQATNIVQAVVRDAATGKVLRKIPDDAWLKVVRELRAFASEAIIDRKA
ncbi:flagellar biosynthesis protein FlaG [Solidesulfovibrio sp. C21]|uniref:flagellar biosynthesis protein FlaG n=1 Tax=Solidesulfovibrio sp. C21 TaxID=3398613 RepID=UPI0039FBC782